MAVIKLPTRSRGGQTQAAKDRYTGEVRQFCAALEEVAKTIPFPVSSRGWCYILEEHGLMKGDFDKAQALINECRENVMLPLDICAEDASRVADIPIEKVDTGSLEWNANFLFNYHVSRYEQAEEIAKEALRKATYRPYGFWSYQPVYIEVMVEKIDLRSLFAPTCNDFNVPIQNAKGWNDLHARGAILRRMQEHQQAGRQCVLLYCGDFDPAGVNISTRLRDNFAQLVGCRYRNGDRLDVNLDEIVFRRFGLNYDFIMDNGLTWIDNIQTGSGKDLADPLHEHNRHEYVQSYLSKYGPRKCEANALVTRVSAAHALIESVLFEYLDERRMHARDMDNAAAQKAVRAILKDRAKKEKGWDL